MVGRENATGLTYLESVHVQWGQLSLERADILKRSFVLLASASRPASELFVCIATR